MNRTHRIRATLAVAVVIIIGGCGQFSGAPAGGESTADFLLGASGEVGQCRSPVHGPADNGLIAYSEVKEYDA